MTSCDRTPCNTQLTTNNSTSRTNCTVRSTQSTTSQVTATVVRDAIPECLAHVTLIVASENLFLQWLVSAVRTERRIAGQTGHATSIKQHLVTKLFTGSKLLLREPVIITNHIPSPVYLLIPHSQSVDSDVDSPALYVSVLPLAGYTTLPIVSARRRHKQVTNHCVSSNALSHNVKKTDPGSTSGIASTQNFLSSKGCPLPPTPVRFCQHPSQQS